MKRWLGVVGVLVTLMAPASWSAPLHGQDAGSADRIDRLERLGELWASVALLHPRSDALESAWDSALVAHLPSIEAAEGPDGYAAALQRLLETLEDPATRVLESSRTPDPSPELLDERQPTWSEPGNGVLVVRLTDYVDLSWDPEAPTRLRAALERMPHARQVVLDLRPARTSPELGGGLLDWFLHAGGFDGALLPPGLEMPRERWRMHEGLVGDGTYSAGVYWSGHSFRDPLPVQGAASAVAPPVTFLVDGESDLPVRAMALRHAGRARILSHGPPPAVPGTVRTLDMGEGVRAAVRLSDQVFRSGPPAAVADAVLDAGLSWEEALEAAVRMAADASPVRDSPRSPGTAVLATADVAPTSGPDGRDGAVGGPAAERRTGEAGAGGAAGTVPSRAERILAAYRIQSNVEHFFAYPDLMDRPWDGVLAEVLPDFEAAEDSESYALAVAAMVERLDDGHAVVRGPGMDAFVGVAHPPVDVRFVEGAPVIVAVRDSAAGAPARPGDVIVEIDGRPVTERIAEQRPYRAASTPWAEDYYLARRILAGPDASTVALGVRRGDGRVHRYELPRATEHMGRSARSGPVYELRDDGIGYVDLDRLDNDAVSTMFEALKGARAIVFDGRGYPRGTLWALVPYLGLGPDEAIAAFRVPVVLANQHVDLESRLEQQALQRVVGASPPFVYRGPTVMLVDERTQSQAEHTAMAFRAANGTKFVGGPTAGANGNVSRFELPGGLTVTFTAMEASWPDGTRLQRRGIEPDVAVHPTVQGIREGRDELLDAAIAYLREALATEEEPGS